MSVERDDWDTHWLEFNEAAEDNPAQRFRRRTVEQLLAIQGRRARVLDIGSGQGDLAEQLVSRYPHAEILGLEYSRSGVEISRRKVPQATFIQRDLTVNESPPDGRVGWATHAVCSEVLEHMDDPELLLRNAVAFCAPGCRMVVTVPAGPMSVFDRHIGHRRHYTVAALRGVLEAAGLRVQRVHSVGFPMFNLYRLVVIARGSQLVEDLAAGDGRTVSLPARIAMRVFRTLLSIPIPIHRFGWQLVAVARVPAPGG